MSDFDRVLDEASAAGRRAATPLPASQIRRVGNRVHRVRAITAATLSVAAVAAVVIVVTTGAVPNAAPDYVDSPGPTEPTSPPTTSDPATSPPAPDPILAGNMLTALPLGEFYFGGESLGWVESDSTAEIRCRLDLAASAPEAAHVGFTAADSDEMRVDQWAEAYGTTDEAATRLGELRTALGDCAEADDEVDLFEAYTVDGVGDGGFIANMFEPHPPDTDAALYTTFRAAQTGRAVTWTTFVQVKTESLDRPEAAELAIAVDQLCDPAGGACAGDAVLTRTYPNSDDVDAPGLLTVEEVNSQFAGRWRSAQVGAPSGDVPNVVCSGQSLADAGGTDLLRRSFFDEDDPEEPQITQVAVTRGLLGSSELAGSYVSQQETSWADCSVLGSAPVRLAPSAELWRIDFGDHQSYYGFATAGAHVLVVEWTAVTVDDDAFFDLVSLATHRLQAYDAGLE